MKTTISISAETSARIGVAAARLGITRDEFLARAAERWLDDLEGTGATAAIDAALGDEQSTAFAGRAGRTLIQRADW